MKVKNYVIFGTRALGIHFAKALQSSENEMIMVNRSGICPEPSVTATIQMVDALNKKQVVEVLI